MISAGPVIDCDVHNSWACAEEFYAYLKPEWREYVFGPGVSGPIPVTATLAYTQPQGWWREEEVNANGELKLPTPHETVEHLLEAHNVTRAILTFEELLYVANIPNPYYADELARASNDWMCDTWLAADPRFFGSILIANQLPELAAREIDRLADNGRLVALVMANNGLGQPLGHPLFDPIYERASAYGLPVALHSFQSGGVNPVETAGGRPHFYIEYHALVNQGLMTTLVSFIANGVFDKFPGLKLALLEGGVGWLPPLIWRLDAAFEQFYAEMPWCSRRPSEYIRDHVRLSTQPLEGVSDQQDLVPALESVGAENLLMFASDYPHWDADEADYVARRLPEDWQRKVLHDNARAFYRWPDDADGHSVGCDAGTSARKA